jgi:putative ABC transport system permease protein
MTPAREIVSQAVHALLQHRVRAALSVAGLVFGVASVTASLAIADGARISAERQFGALGVRNVLIRDHSAAGHAPVLERADLDPVAAIGSRVVRTSATRVADVTAGGNGRRVAGTPLAGVTADWPAMTNTTLAAGRWPSAKELDQFRRVAVIGPGLARTLFGSLSPIGARLLAGESWYDVIGVAASSTVPRSSLSLFDLDRAVIVPFATMDSSQGHGDAVTAARELAIEIESTDQVDRAAAVIGAVMARRHPDGDRYRVVVPKELLGAEVAARRSANVVLLAIGAIALLISGVGIMNIMLANVIERTPEIGVRRAFGARRPDILAQFAVESALLCAAGGAAGIPIGAAFAGVAAWAGGWPISISFPSVLIALGLATSVGVGFGLYPARRAADIQPVDALRA